MVTGPGQEQSRLLVFQTVAPDDAAILFRLANFQAECLRQTWGVTARFLRPQPADSELKKTLHEPMGRLQACFLQGPDLDRLLPGAGTVLVQRAAGSVGLVVINSFTVASEAAAKSLVIRLEKQVEVLDADRFGPVQYRVSANGTLEDLKTGLSLPGDATATDFRALWLSGLPLPPELHPLLTPS